VTMRTPGSDFELAAGFLFSEGLIGADAVRRIAYCDDITDEEQRYNVVTVTTADPFDHGALHRNFYATSSCGVCGKASLDDVALHCEPVGPGPVVRPEVISGLPEKLRSAQRVFDRTGGLHAAGLFEPEGRLLTVKEDIGRHNAVDKVIGEMLLSADLPLDRHVLQVSGRVSFEIVQKAAMARIPIVCAVSAPSSLAVEAGDRFGMTIIGFVRDGRLNVYSHPERIAD
jgi:FdhD protein